MAKRSSRETIDPADARAGDRIFAYGEWGTVVSTDVYFGSIMEYWTEFPGRFETITSDEVEHVERERQ